jgi:hypothetical protein
MYCMLISLHPAFHKVSHLFERMELSEFTQIDQSYKVTPSCVFLTLISLQVLLVIYMFVWEKAERARGRLTRSAMYIE